MQFLLRLDGRPITGERSCAPNVVYHDDAESRHFRKIREYYRNHPNGPFVYSEWSDIPDDERLREKWFTYLKLYKPMVSEDSLCFIDIAKDRRILTAPAGNDIHISMFVNDVCYLCISNLGKSSGKLVFQDCFFCYCTNCSGFKCCPFSKYYFCIFVCFCLIFS